jgi:hypothetical protein
MPARKIGKSYVNVTGVVASGRVARMVQFESLLERDLIRLMEFHPSVLDFEEQPITIEWWDATEKPHRYTPDFLIRFKGPGFIRNGSTVKPWLVEVKTRSKLASQWENLKPRFQAAVREAAHQGWIFHLITDSEIRTPYLQNVNFLRAARNHSCNPEAVARIRRTVDSTSQCTVGLLTESLSRDELTKAQLVPNVWKMILAGDLRVDMQAPISNHSRVWLPKQEGSR